MRIKKHPTGNRYILSEGIWIRDFTKEVLVPINVSPMFEKADQKLVVQNEEGNRSYPAIANEKIRFKKIVIVSDGFDFDTRHRSLAKLPKEVGILAVNRALAKWKLYSQSSELKKTINAYVINNPYQDALINLPTKDCKYYPVCLASLRTNKEFCKKYVGDIYTYTPTPEESFGGPKQSGYTIDDYRNPICAAIGLAYRFGVEKLALVCCDDAFTEPKEWAVPTMNGLWTYPQHMISQSIIDANLQWIASHEGRKIKVANYSLGADYKNAAYIKTEDELMNFFTEIVEEKTPNE